MKIISVNAADFQQRNPVFEISPQEITQEPHAGFALGLLLNKAGLNGML